MYYYVMFTAHTHTTYTSLISFNMINLHRMVYFCCIKKSSSDHSKNKNEKNSVETKILFENHCFCHIWNIINGNERQKKEKFLSFFFEKFFEDSNFIFFVREIIMDSIFSFFNKTKRMNRTWLLFFFLVLLLHFKFFSFSSEKKNPFGYEKKWRKNERCKFFLYLHSTHFHHRFVFISFFSLS